MRDTIKRILREDSKDKYVLYILKDLVDKAEVLETNPYDGNPCVRYPHYMSNYESIDDCEDVLGVGARMEQPFKDMMVKNYGFNDMSIAKVIWGKYIAGVEEKFNVEMFGDEEYD